MELQLFKIEYRHTYGGDRVKWITLWWYKKELKRSRVYFTFAAEDKEEVRLCLN